MDATVFSIRPSVSLCRIRCCLAALSTGSAQLAYWIVTSRSSFRTSSVVGIVGRAGKSEVAKLCSRGRLSLELLSVGVSKVTGPLLRSTSLLDWWRGHGGSAQLAYWIVTSRNSFRTSSVVGIVGRAGKSEAPGAGQGVSEKAAFVSHATVVAARVAGSVSLPDVLLESGAGRLLNNSQCGVHVFGTPLEHMSFGSEPLSEGLQLELKGLSCCEDSGLVAAMIRQKDVVRAMRRNLTAVRFFQRECSRSSFWREVACGALRSQLEEDEQGEAEEAELRTRFRGVTVNSGSIRGNFLNWEVEQGGWEMSGGKIQKRELKTERSETS
ncbi:hypothetical protein F2Q70_00013418 [Brassica cretica]|uniref:Uncharacterized protein n=1 Tax=Brassica cretica TaxID=69181 RepID=A0A8S9M940_BRACR|nr:hypothetical protein F2Q70_00013418 [Brassica cretica]